MLSVNSKNWKMLFEGHLFNLYFTDIIKIIVITFNNNSMTIGYILKVAVVKRSFKYWREIPKIFRFFYIT